MWEESSAEREEKKLINHRERENEGKLAAESLLDELKRQKRGLSHIHL